MIKSNFPTVIRDVLTLIEDFTTSAVEHYDLRADVGDTQNMSSPSLVAPQFSTIVRLCGQDAMQSLDVTPSSA